MFWWDNFDWNVQIASGSGSIHTIPGVAFQEEGVGTTVRNEEIGIPKSKRRFIQPM